MKDVATADHVGKIIYNFKSTSVQSWINTKEAHLLSLMFPKFLTALKKKFLPRSWEDDLMQEQIVLQGSTNFLTWVNSIHNANDKLGMTKSDYHITDDCFHLHLIPWLSDGMKHLHKANNGSAPGVKKGTLDAITDFEEWMERLQLLEQDLQASRAGWVSHAAKAGHILHDSSTLNVENSNPTPLTMYTSLLKPLSEEEKMLLRENLGCYKCRVFYTGHLGHNCTNPHPSLEDCKKVMAANAAKAKAAYEKTPASLQHTRSNIAAVFPNDTTMEEDESDSSSNNFMDVSKVDEYINSLLTLPPHLHWTCHIDAPTTCALTPIVALIDHSSPPVLISSDLAEILCLPAKPLFKPLLVSGAFRKS